MAARNSIVTYLGGVTSGDVLNALMNELVALGWTLIEDSITSDDFFVVQDDKPTDALSRAIFRVGYANISATDYITFTLYGAWAPGAPGSGSNPVGLNDPSQSPTTGTAQRFHLLDLTNGGQFFIDYDDAVGGYLHVASEANAVLNLTRTMMTTCTIKHDTFPNYGVLGFGITVTYYSELNDLARLCCWFPPQNHVGTVSSGIEGIRNVLQTANDEAGYCVSPVFAHDNPQNPGTFVLGPVEVDTYNKDTGVDLAWPLLIGNFDDTIDSVANGAAMGFRGEMEGFKGIRAGLGVAPRTTINVNGKRFLAYPGEDGASVSELRLYYLVPAA